MEVGACDFPSAAADTLHTLNALPSPRLPASSDPLLGPNAHLPPNLVRIQVVWVLRTQSRGHLGHAHLQLHLAPF